MSLIIASRISATEVLEVACKTATAGQPRERPLDDPALRQHDEAAGSLGALDDVQPPATTAAGRISGAWPLVSGIGEDGEDEGEQRPRAVIQHQRGTVAVLDVGRVHDDGQQQAERVDEDVVLDAIDPLARVETNRVNPRPPFSAALTDLLSRIAAVGLASLPACSRQAT